MSTVETAVGQIVWHTLLTNDVEAAKDFYGKLLGWEYELFEAGGMSVPMISQHGKQHGGLRPIEPGQNVPPHWYGYVLVEDLDDTVRRVEAAGGRVVVPPMVIPTVGRFSVFADPQGAVIAAFTPDDEMDPPTGTFLWEELLADDVEAAKSFYGEVFGWTTTEMDVGIGPYTIFNRAGDVMSGGVYQKPAEDPGPPRWVTYLATDDVEAAVTRAKELGATVFVEGMDVPTVGTIAVLADPAGAMFGLFKPNQPAA